MRSECPPPNAEFQLVFLSKLQRLFAEGDFTATYKFALLISLADLAVELGDDGGDELRLNLPQLSERFLGLYWRHALPYAAAVPGAKPGVLSQNIGSQAAVLRTIEAFRHESGAASLFEARLRPGYRTMLSKIGAVVSAQPLRYLQNFGGGTDPFLYERTSPGVITLKPGVAYCLRRFYPLVQQLSRSHWVGHIKANRRNQDILGSADDLGDFLFSASRQSLAIVGRELRKLDGGNCFYCGQRVNEVDVDHFVPFSLYPRDLAGNFVIAHPTCNRSKSASLAARSHLERWLERLLLKSDQLQEIGAAAGIPADANTIHRVAAWSYTSAVNAQARAWVSPAEYETVDETYAEIFAVRATDDACQGLG